MFTIEYSRKKKIFELIFSHAHKNTCMALKWNRHNGNWLISASRDHFCKLFDIRNLKEEVQCFRGHKKEACSKHCLFVDRLEIKCVYFILFIFHTRIKEIRIKNFKEKIIYIDRYIYSLVLLFLFQINKINNRLFFFQ
jgi:hypothetical protein